MMIYNYKYIEIFGVYREKVDGNKFLVNIEGGKIYDLTLAFVSLENY